MNKVSLDHIRCRREVAVARLDCALIRSGVVAERVNGVLRNSADSGWYGGENNSANADEACRVGVGADIANRVAGAGGIRAGFVNSIDVVGAYNIVCN